MSLLAISSHSDSLPHPHVRSIARWALFPSALAAAAIGAMALLDGRMPAMAIQMSVFVIAVTLAVLAERWLPFRSDWADVPKRERRVDATSWAVLMGIADPLISMGLLPLLLSVVVSFAPSGGMGVFPSGWPFISAFVMAVVVAEFGQYWAHRTAHRQPWMWNVHSLHHGPPRLYWMNGFRVNPLNMAWHKLAGVFVLMVLGAPPVVIQSVILLATVISVFQHVNTDLRFDGWNLVLSTADLHRWHHDAAPGKPVGNFGGVVTLWDRIFGSFIPATAPSPEVVGIPGAERTQGGYFEWLRRTTVLPASVGDDARTQRAFGKP